MIILLFDKRNPVSCHLKNQKQNHPHTGKLVWNPNLKADLTKQCRMYSPRETAARRCDACRKTPASFIQLSDNAWLHNCLCN